MQNDSDLGENQPDTYEPPPPQSRAPQYGAPQYGASPIYPNEPYRYREEVTEFLAEHLMIARRSEFSSASCLMRN